MFSCINSDREIGKDDIQIMNMDTSNNVIETDSLQHNNELIGGVIELDLEYILWGCNCPNWITPKDKKLYENDTLSAHCIYIEPKDSSLYQPDSEFDYKNSIISVSGQFYKLPGIPYKYANSKKSSEPFFEGKIFQYSKISVKPKK